MEKYVSSHKVKPKTDFPGETQLVKVDNQVLERHGTCERALRKPDAQKISSGLRRGRKSPFAEVGFGIFGKNLDLFFSWAVFLLNCRSLTEVQWFEPVQLR